MVNTMEGVSAIKRYGNRQLTEDHLEPEQEIIPTVMSNEENVTSPNKSDRVNNCNNEKKLFDIECELSEYSNAVTSDPTVQPF